MTDHLAPVVPLRQAVDVPMRRCVAEQDDVRDLLPDGDTIETAVPFGDDVWDLVGHVSWKDKAGQQTKVDFTRIPGRWRLLAKHWVLASVTPGLVATWLGESHDDALTGQPPGCQRLDC